MKRPAWMHWPAGRMLRRCVTLGACIGAGALASMAWQESQPPARFMQVKEDDGIVAPNGRAVVLYHLHKSLDCPVEVTRWIYSEVSAADPETGPIFDPISTSSSPPVPLGDDRFGIVLHIPMDTPPGFYQLMSRSQYWGMCGLFHPRPLNSTAARLQVLAGVPGSEPRVVIAPPGEAVTVVQGKRP